MTRSRPAKRTGFTLFQLLVLLALLGLLLALLLPAIQKVREAASRAQSQNNLRQIALAMHNIDDTFKAVPLIAGPWKGIDPNKGPQSVSFFFCLLPFIEQENLYKVALAGEDTAYDKTIRIYVSPADFSAGPGHRYQGWLATSSYAANYLAFQQPPGNPQPYASIPRSFPDGLSNTIVFAERYQMCGGQPCAWAYAGLYSWTAMFGYYSTGKYQVAPTAAQCDPALPQTPYSGGMSVALADGSVRILSRDLSLQTWLRACSPADGLVLGPDW